MKHLLFICLLALSSCTDTSAPKTESEAAYFMHAARQNYSRAKLGYDEQRNQPKVVVPAIDQIVKLWQEKDAYASKWQQKSQTLGISFERCYETEEWLLHNQQLHGWLLLKAKEIVMPIDDIFSEASLSQMRPALKEAMLYKLSEKVISSYCHTYNTLPSSQSFRVASNDTIALGDTLTAFFFNKEIYADSLLPGHTEVFVPEGEATLSHTRISPKQQAVQLVCIPSQRGPHYIRHTFQMYSPAQATFSFEVGRCVWVK